MATIFGYAQLASPVGADLMEVVDTSDTTMSPNGTNKKVALSDLKTFIKTGPAHLGAKPAAPAATASLTLVMMGLGTTLALTPGSSGLVQVTLAFQAFTNTAAVQCTVGGRFGTGTAPVNGAAVTGTRWGNNGDFTVLPPSLASGVPITFTDLITLTPGTAYWFDLCMLTSVAADTAVPKNLSFTAVEIS